MLESQLRDELHKAEVLAQFNTDITRHSDSLASTQVTPPRHGSLNVVGIQDTDADRENNKVSPNPILTPTLVFQFGDNLESFFALQFL